MSTTYRVATGDTFESVARKVYGSEVYATRVSQANPGAAEPLVAGTSLTTPPLSTAPSDKTAAAPADSPNEVSVEIDGERFRFWTQLRLTRSLDAMDTLEFSAPFDASAPGFRETFRPFSYKPLTVSVGGTLLFKGTLIGVNPELTATRKTLAVSGYSRPGVLNDCTAPASAQLEFNDLALPEIAASLASLFGIPVEFVDTNGGAAFGRVAVAPTGTVLSFLADLARQRSLVVSSTPEGRLLFRPSTVGAPVATLSQGESPLLSVTPFFSPQQYYSHVTGLESVIVGGAGSQYTVKNPHLAGVLRPITFRTPDVEGGDVKTSVDAKAGRMYGNMASYSVNVSTWRDPSGALWAPNTSIVLSAPDAMIYSPYTFVVRSVRFEKTSNSETARLDVVVPGAFSGETPEALPWD